MKPHSYKIFKGEILFDDDKVVIKDQVKKQLRFSLILSPIWFFNGLFTALNYNNNDSLDSSFLLWVGIFLCIVSIVLFIFNFKKYRTTKNEILNSEIVSFEFKGKMKTKFLDIKMVGDIDRRVTLVGNSYINGDIRECIESNFHKDQII